MQNANNRKNGSDRKPWMNRASEKSKRNNRRFKERDDYEFMREDMRGAMEDIGDFPTESAQSKPVKDSKRQSESMVNEGGRS